MRNPIMRLKWGRVRKKYLIRSLKPKIKTCSKMRISWKAILRKSLSFPDFRTRAGENYFVKTPLQRCKRYSRVRHSWERQQPMEWRQRRSPRLKRMGSPILNKPLQYKRKNDTEGNYLNVSPQTQCMDFQQLLKRNLEKIKQSILAFYPNEIRLCFFHKWTNQRPK